MTSVYISSTYKDLAIYREAVARILRKMKKIVVSMEDYTASDERPLDKCLQDVRECDVYIGIFAYRYGFIPPHDNEKGLSITELELEHARSLKKPCLIFLNDESAPWPPPDMDAYNGEGDQGRRIRELRDRLGIEYNRNLFKSPDDLAASVSSAVANFERQQSGRDAERDRATDLVEPMPREITFDLLLAYSDIDSEYVSALADYLNSQKLRLVLDQRAIFASRPDDFERLERSIRACHAAALVVSDTSLRQLQERRLASDKVLRIMEARTDNLMSLCLDKHCADTMSEWPLPGVEDLSGWKPREKLAPTSLQKSIENLRWATGLDSGKRWIGLPVIVVAMTGDEAGSICADPTIVEQKLGLAASGRFRELSAAIAEQSVGSPGRFAASREDCRPFSGSDVSIKRFLDAMVERINDDQPFELRGRLIKLQQYRFDELMEDGDQVGPIYTQLLSTGCVLIVDEYSLFHPKLQESLVASGLLANEQVSMVTLSPTNPYSKPPLDFLEVELRRRMTAAFDRFASIYDPQCELSVGDEKRLKRWLNSSLPHAIQSLRHPKVNRQNISQFAREQGLDPRPRIGTLLYSQGGPL